MKSRKHSSAIALAVVALAGAADAASLMETYNFGGGAVPDGDPSGLALAPVVSGSAITTIESVTVEIMLTTTWNGDLFMHLSHESGYAVLLNRAGRTPGSPFGYDDHGFTIRLDDSAPDNVHAYQGITGDLPDGVGLTGLWKPDGRDVDPDQVDGTEIPTALLDSFDGLGADGQWVLFIADLSGGSAATLDNWSLEITGIPEPSAVALLGLGAAAIGLRRRRRHDRRLLQNRSQD